MNVAYGQDVIQDGFIPVFGTGDPLQVGFLLAFAAQLSTRRDVETLYDMATVNGARLMRLRDYGLEVGRRADLVVIAAPSVQEAYRTQAARRAVIHGGRIVARGGQARGGQSLTPSSARSRENANQGQTRRSASSTSAKRPIAMTASSSMAANARFDFQYDVAETMT